MKVILKKDVSNKSFRCTPKNKINDLNSIFFNILSFGYEEIRKKYYLKRAEFHGNMLTYIISGSGNLIFRNRQYSLKKDDLVLINCMDEHTMYPNEEGMNIYYMHIDNNQMADFANDIEKISSAVFNFKDDYKIKAFFESVVKEGTTVVDNTEISKKLYDLLIDIRLKAIGETNSNLSMPEALKNIIDYIKDNCHDPNLSLEKIAKHANFNKFYLEKLFKKHLKTTVHNYLCNERLNNARHLLLSTSLSIEDISIQTGFSGSQLLIKNFKKVYKETPLQYRKRRIA